MLKGIYFMKNSHNRKLHILPSIFAIPIIAIFLLTVSVNVHSASASTYFPMIQNENNIIPEAVSNYVFNNYSNYDHIFLYGPYVDYDPSYPTYLFVAWSGGSVYGTVEQNLYSFRLGKSGNTSFLSGEVRYIVANGSVVLAGTNYSNFMYNIAYVSNLYTTSKDYLVSDDFFSNNGDVLIFAEAPLVVPDTGHAQDPSNNIPTFSYPIGMHPTSVPTVPTYTAPTIPSLPSFDLDHPFESLFNILDWFANGVIDTLNSFIQIFIDWLHFLGDLIVWLFKSFIDFCTSFWNWLYRIFKFLFEPIYDFLSNFFKFLFNEDDQLSVYDQIKQFKDFVVSWCSGYWSNSWLSDFFTNIIGTYDYFATLFSKLLLFFDKVIQLGTVNNEFSILNLVKALFVPDVTTVTAHLMGHDAFYFYSTGHALVDKGNYIITTITTLTPAKTFYVPSTTWHGQNIGGFYIDFSWYDDYKTYGDLIISTFLSLSFVYWVLINMSNFIRGQSSVGSDVSRLEK